jgi:hypothetical protein
MDIKVEQRAVIKFLWHKGFTEEQSQPRLQAVYGDDIYVFQTSTGRFVPSKLARKALSMTLDLQDLLSIILMLNFFHY